jgi:predicted membrane chloride channel (bestrophin family)
MMTHEQRLDRLERIARLMVRAGLRARREMRQQDDKITIMIDAQIKNEDRYADLAASRNQHDEQIALLIGAQLRNEERFAELSDSQKRLSESQQRLSDSQQNTDRILAELAESQKHTDRRLNALMEIVQKDRNGKSRKEP